MTDVRIVVAAPAAAEAVRCLTRLGYAVIGPAASGQDAVRLAAEARPDLALLDITLRGPVDGPAAAARFRRQLGLPVVLFVPTAAALDQALAADPDGLALGPLEPARLRAAVELALARRRAEDALRRKAGRLAATLDGMADAVLAADAQGRVTYLNAAAELVTGHTREDALGQPAPQILDLREEETGRPVTDPVRWALDQGRAPGRGLLQPYSGETVPVRVTVGRVAGESGEPVGAVLVVRDVSAGPGHGGSAAQVAGGLAGQFDNLLTVVTGYSDLLAGAVGPSHPWKRLLDEIRMAGERAAVLTRHLLSRGLAPDASQPAALQMPGLPRGSETILLAEAERMVRDLNRQILQMCGYRVLAARDAAEALAVNAAHAEGIDLLVTEVRMPRVSGPELARAAAARRPGLRVLFLSGAVEDDAAGLPGGALMLAKPYSVSELARTVREILDAGAGPGPPGPVSP